MLLWATGSIWIGHVLYDRLDVRDPMSALEGTSKGAIRTEVNVSFKFFKPCYISS